MKFYPWLRLDIVALSGVLVITDFIQGWWRQAFRMRTPSRGGGGAEYCCIWPGGRIYCSCSFLTYVFLFTVLPWFSSAMNWPLLLVFSLLPLDLVFFIPMLILSGACVPSCCNRVFFLIPLCKFVHSSSRKSCRPSKISGVFCFVLEVQKQWS